MDDRDRDRAQLRAEIADLSARLSHAAAVAQVETRARRELGLVPADPEQTTFIQLGG
jgi:cell division protein FtsB